MKRTRKTLAGVVVLLLTLVPSTPALLAQGPARPAGIYAKVNISSDIAQQQKANPNITPAGLSAYFVSLYQALLADSAISGLALQAHWDQVNPNPPSAADAYDWGYLDDAFNQVALWNAQNPGQPPKTIQLIMTPGYQSPRWVLDRIPSCDGLFQSQTPPSTCGKVTFTGFGEAADGPVLPLPWNPVYKSAWRTFLTALAARYGSNPAFVSIGVAGPTAASEEITTASNTNADNPQSLSGISPNEMWRQLMQFHYPGMTAYHGTDQAFIDEWKAAIDMYGEVFGGVTLVATTGSGLPNFNSRADNPIPAGFEGDCPRADMECAAVATILSYFVQPSVGGPNAKATQTSGMEASRADNPDLGVSGVKRLSGSTAQQTAPSAQILGGAQFNSNFSVNTLKEGCTSTFPPKANDAPEGCMIPPGCTAEGCLPSTCIPQACLAPGVTPASLAEYKNFKAVPPEDLIPPEQAEYNVLNVFFSGTAAASAFGAAAGTPPAPLNYLQIYREDIQYAQTNSNTLATVVRPDGATFSTTAQVLLDMASQALFLIGEDTVPAASAGAQAEPANSHVELYGWVTNPPQVGNCWQPAPHSIPGRCPWL